jgi:hypothetical protein
MGSNINNYWEARVSNFTGDLTGARTFEFRTVIHLNSGKVTGQSHGIFVGTIWIDGTPYTGEAVMNGSMLAIMGGSYTATLRIVGVKGTGLEGIHGVLECTPGNYSGIIHVDPPQD